MNEPMRGLGQYLVIDEIEIVEVRERTSRPEGTSNCVFEVKASTESLRCGLRFEVGIPNHFLNSLRPDEVGRAVWMGPDDPKFIFGLPRRTILTGASTPDQRKQRIRELEDEIESIRVGRTP
jgi:hypothetical protein